VYKITTETAEIIRIKLFIPRSVKNQLHCENYKGDPEAYLLI